MRAVLGAVAALALLASASFVSAYPGDLDEDFGTGGVVVDATRGPGRGILVGIAHTIWVLQGSTHLAAYAFDGTPAGAFGVGGSVATPFDVMAIAFDKSGSGILAAGFSGGQVAIARFQLNGTLDPTFGTGGVTVTAVPGTPAGLVVQGTGAIVVGGGTVLVRFTSSGVQDGTFGTGGVVDTSANGTVAALALGPGNSIVTAGTGGVGVAVVRYDAGGTLDGTFGSGGIFTTNAEDVSALYDVTVRDDGSVVATGSDAFLNMATLRLTAGGGLDTTFAFDGILVNTFYGLSFGKAVVPDSAGVNVIVGAEVIPSLSMGSTSDVLIVRIESDGMPDQTFGIDGIVSSDLGSSSTPGAVTADAFAPSIEFLLVTGSRAGASPSGHFFLARYELGELCKPMATCKGGVSGKSGLQLRDDVDDSKDRMQWTYRKGDATTLAEIGNPLADHRYALCLFDMPGATSTVGTLLHPGGLCDGKPCWKASPTSFRYQSKSRTPSGVQSLQIKAGAAGKAAITLKAGGALLPDLDLPRDVPVLMQLQSETGTCWESYFSTTVSKNDGVQFKAKSD